MIYCIYLFDTATEYKHNVTEFDFKGYCETYEEAVKVMHDELVYDHLQCNKTGGFIFRMHPGVGVNGPYIPKGEDRTFFLYDTDLDGFYESEEPDGWKRFILIL